MKKILIAINYSEHSPAIVKYGFKLAQYFSAKVDVVYILHEAQIALYDNKYTDDAVEKRLNKEEKKLTEFINKLYAKQYHDVPLESHVRIGRAKENIKLLALELRSDLVVVGKGYYATYEDTADSLIRSNSCPTMILPEHIEYHNVQRILYASDFVLEDCEAILQLQEWLSIYKGELICIHLSKTKEQEIQSKRKLNVLRKLFPQKNIKFRSIVADPGEGIHRYLELSKSDILCTMHKERNFFQWLFKPSLSKKLSDQVKVPMIVFHQNI